MRRDIQFAVGTPEPLEVKLGLDKGSGLSKPCIIFGVLDRKTLVLIGWLNASH